MLRFQVTLVGSSCKAGAANLTVDATTLPVRGCSSLRFVLGILLLCVTLSYPSRNAYYRFHFGSVCKQTNPFKQSDEDVEGFLPPDWVPRGNQPIVNVKRHQNFSYMIPKPIAGSFFTKRLVEPFPDYGINTHVEHERGEQTLLRNAPSSTKRLPVISPALHTNCAVSQKCFWSASTFGPTP